LSRSGQIPDKRQRAFSRAVDQVLEIFLPAGERLGVAVAIQDVAG